MQASTDLYTSISKHLETLADLARRNATGELICASESLEVHIYVQHGRVAWATDSTSPLAFTRYLLEDAKLDPEVFREILESCRREKRPLGETLVGWGVATWEQVRAALAYQIRRALEVLRSAGPVQTLFLNRKAQFSNYDPKLTFTLAELARVTPTAIPSAPPPPASTPLRHERQSSVQSSAASRVLRSLENIVWVETLEGVRLVEAVPEPTLDSNVPAELVRGTLLDGAELVVLRRATTTLAGVNLSKSRSIWCVADSEATVGAIVTTLTSLAPEEVSAGEPLATDGEPWTFGAADPHANVVLREIIERASDVHAVIVTDPSLPIATCGVGRQALSAEAIRALVERRTMALSCTDAVGDAREQAPDGISQMRVMTAERDFYLFATPVVTGQSIRFVWLVVDKRSSKGVGWAFITSVGRQLLRASPGGR